MASQGIHGNLLEVTVVSCNKLKDTEWISRQDPYVSVEYGSNRSTTRTCKDGGKNPTFQEKFVYTLIEGLRELNVTVWNSNTLTHDDYIGSGKIPLAKALSQGFDDSSWPLQSKTGRHAGEVRLIMHYANTNKPENYNTQKPSKGYNPSAQPTYMTHPTSMYAPPPPPPHAAMYPTPPSTTMYHTPPPGAYPPSSSYPSYPPNPNVYPPSPYPPPPNPTYPPPPNPTYGSHYPPSPSFPGMYPPPPY